MWIDFTLMGDREVCLVRQKQERMEVESGCNVIFY